MHNKNLKKVVRIKNLEIGEIPRIVASVDDSISPIIFPTLKEKGVDILEVRIDRFLQLDYNHILSHLKKIREIWNQPIIGTIRDRKEEIEGNADLNDQTRLELFKLIIPIIDIIDIELRSSMVQEVVRLTKSKGKVSLVSYHNFDKTPPFEELEKILSKAREMQADIVKIAAWANTNQDIIRLLNFTEKNRKDYLIVSIALGSLGSISRIIAPLFGSCLTYGFIEKPVARGQFDIDTLVNQLRLLYPSYNQDYITRTKSLEMG